MVDQKQRFFIYDRKEMGVLLLLGVLVAVFAFTLGVHLGKRVEQKPSTPTPHEAPTEAAAVPTVPDQLPNRQELTEQSKGAQQAADETLSQTLHDEVARTGIKLDTPKQTQLPEKTKPEKVKPEKAHSAPSHENPALTREAPAGKFTLQIGSFPVLEEAQDQADSLEALGMKPFLRPAEVKGKRWYRVYVGGFQTKEAAEKAGARYVSQHMIEAYVVSKMIDQ